MRLLILGGTRFLGHHLAAAARARGHDVTLFHRGKHSVVATGDVQTIHGDRHRDLDKLRGRSWDAAIDTCGYLPQSVKASAEAISVERYVFISSLSVYREYGDESAPLAELTAEQVQQAHVIDTSGPVSAATFGNLYGGLKVLCERAAEEVLPQRVLSIRPGVIAGPHDYTDRLTYWAVRVARGGEVLAPGRPGRFVQFIDARDLAEWIIHATERGLTGAFNATGPRESVTMSSLLETCRAVTGSDARFTWVDDQFLLDEGVTPWTELPLWLGRESTFTTASSQKAVDAGLRYRPLSETVGDTLRWFATESRELRTGLEAERERQLLRAWRAADNVSKLAEH